jgi:uncharacterized pyridoxamine 5'-phosphate oxidase family protein
MEVASFEEIQTEFIDRIQQAVYCNVTTIDRKDRPRSRVMHVIWEGPIGWVITWPASHKAKHLAHNPHVSLAYVAQPTKPVYVEAIAAWVTELNEQQRIWDLHKALPPPLGFDPTPHYSTIQGQYFGVLRFTPWRIELAELGAESLIWRPAQAKTVMNSNIP